jgi:signal transduction histidine kinase
MYILWKAGVLPKIRRHLFCERLFAQASSSKLAIMKGDLDQTDTQENAVLEERVRLIYSKGLAALVTNLINSFIMVVVLWDSTSHRSSLIWLATMCVVVGVRTAIWWRYRSRGIDACNAGSGALVWIVGAGVTGIIWGSMGLIFLPVVPLGAQYVILFVIGGMVAGASASMSSYWLGFVVFATPALMLPILRFAQMGDSERMVTVLLLAIFGVAMGLIAKTSSDALGRSVRLRIRNILLVDRLNSSQEQLTKLNKDLEERVIERTQELEKALANREQLIAERMAAEREREKLLETLRDADRRKNDFLAMLSHELRNPLAPIRNSLVILNRTMSDNDQTQRARAVIDRQVGYMSRIVDGLLDVTRIARGKVHVERELLNLCEIVQGVVDDHRVVFDQKNIDFQFRSLPAEIWVNGDRTLLAQVIINLLQNSIKFTPSGGKVSLWLSVDTVLAQAAIICLKDTGRGIPPETLSRLFEPFIQADSNSDRKTGGLGLGLSLVKGVIDLHGGSVKAESEGIGQGSTFTIVLPLQKTKAE